MTMKSMKGAFVSLVAIAILSGTALADMKKEIGAGEGQVDIVAWPGYIERGESDKNYDWVTDFEKATKCKVTVKTAATSDEMVTLMNQGGFDLVTSSGDASLHLMHKQPEVGIKNPYELNKDQYAAAIDLLKAQRALVGRYWGDAAVQVDDFKNEGIAASSSWPYQVNLLQADKKPVASTIPEEGATGWADTTMMHAEAAHPNCAYMWLNHSLEPKVQGDVAAWFGSVPAVPSACKGHPLLTDTGCETNGFGNFDKIWFWRTPIGKCENEGSCVPYSQWAKDYIAVQGQ